MQDEWNTFDIFFCRHTAVPPVRASCIIVGRSWRILRNLKYWFLSFRDAGQHNYSRECAEVVLRWKYELSKSLRTLLERSCVVKRWGNEGRSIAADLYLRQLNLLVKVSTMKATAITRHSLRCSSSEYSLLKAMASLSSTS